MHKYISIMDISKYKSYSNINARLLYLHAACHVDTSTYTCVKSTRQLAKELDLTHAQVRHALSMLVADGLVTTQVATHEPTHYATHLMTQPTTHIHIVSVSELDGTNNGTNNTPNNTPSNTPSSTDNRTQINQQTCKRIDTHTLRARAEGLEKLARDEFGLLPDAAAKAVEAFFQRCDLKGKTWESEGDGVAHFVSWCEKRLPRKKVAIGNDHTARLQEYQRSQEADAQETAEEKYKQETLRIMGWYRDGQKKMTKIKDQGEKDKMQEYLTSLKDELKKRKAI